MDYLCLAEVRRQIYRPLPLDEFGAQLPYALNLPSDKEHIEMKEDGTITKIPQRGLDFFKDWMDSLASFDPKIIAASQNKMSTFAKRARAATCPVMKQRKSKRSQCPVGSAVNGVANSGPAEASSEGVTYNPTWDDDVAALFTKPYWVGDPEAVGASWIEMMKSYSTPPREPIP